MPPVRRRRGGGAGGGGVTGAPADGDASVQIRVSADIKQTLQTLLQAAASANETRPKSKLPAVLSGLKLSKVAYSNNLGVVIEALLDYAEIHSARGGKRLWRGSQQDESLEWRAPAKNGGLVPAMQQTTFGDVAAANVAHDPQPRAGGTAAARETARAAQVDPPVALGLAPPDPADRLDGRRGSGWGSVPRPLTEPYVSVLYCVHVLCMRCLR